MLSRYTTNEHFTQATGHTTIMACRQGSVPTTRGWPIGRDKQGHEVGIARNPVVHAESCTCEASPSGIVLYGGCFGLRGGVMLDGRLASFNTQGGTQNQKLLYSGRRLTRTGSNRQFFSQSVPETEPDQAPDMTTGCQDPGMNERRVSLLGSESMQQTLSNTLRLGQHLRGERFFVVRSP